jgi:DNA-binding winged helix-turn-helix (wHTH) protein/predicted ATPase
MRQVRYFVFEPYRLDVLDERLWHGETSVRLGHKALVVLQYLVSQPGQLVTKEALLASAWPDTAVTDAVLTTVMREVRQALGDEARAPRFVETVHGRGYRFIAPVIETNAVIAPADPPVRLVGREEEWARLGEWYTTAQEGKRRIAFIAGEAGIGKTALVEAFAFDAAQQGNVLIGHGQCIEHYGAGEAYLPLLEALGRLGRDAAVPIAPVLREHAPSWLAHLPSLGSSGKLEVLAPVTPARMLRELADALEILTARHPLILVLEDLHWSDTATLEWLAYAVRRRDPARLLVLGTYRPVEALLYNHALRSLIAELRQQPQCAELVLDYLSGDAVQDYLRQRFGSIPSLHELAEVLRRRTGGHPLFLTAIVDELLLRPNPESADLTAMANVIPAGVRQFIERRFEQLSGEEQEILAAASVAGDPFSVAAVAAATAVTDERIEACCAAWAREGRFLAADDAMTWPDGTLAAGYRFRHALYQEVVYAGISPEQRARLHRAVGDRLESAYRKRVATVAAELAMHFEQGRAPRRAVAYLEQAARNALDRSAYSEARRHIEHGRKLLNALPEGRQRLRRELELLLLLGRVLAATKGWAVEEVESVFLRARKLCEELYDTHRLLQALWGLIGVTFVGAEFRKAQALGREVLGLANKRNDPIYGILGHMEVGGTEFHLGEPTAATSRHFLKADSLYDPRQHRSHIACFGVDMGLFSRSWATHFLWHAGYADRARAKTEETLKLARELSHPLTQGVALAYATMLHQLCRDPERVDSLAETTIALCTEHGFPYYLAWAEVLRGWSHAAGGAPQMGIGEIRRGIDVLQAKAGARLSYYRALLAEACGWAGLIDDAFQALADGFADIQKTEERWWEAELHRLRGELLRSETVSRGAEAEASFHRAIEVARGQHAKSLELRAAMSLGRLWRDEGRRHDAHRLVAEVYGWFTEGFDTVDVREARSLLEDLSEAGRARRAVGSSAPPELPAARPTKKRARPLI